MTNKTHCLEVGKSGKKWEKVGKKQGILEELPKHHFIMNHYTCLPKVTKSDQFLKNRYYFDIFQIHGITIYNTCIAKVIKSLLF